MSAIAKIQADPKAFIQYLMDEYDLSDYQIAELETRKLNDVVYEDKPVTFRMAFADGGGEGEGEYVERVIGVKIGRTEIFLQTTGCYDSYNGTEWSREWKQVWPKEVMVIKYTTERP